MPTAQAPEPRRLPILPNRILGRKDTMTIAAGFRFADGILLCADTQISYGGIEKVSGTKILPFEFKNGSKVVFTFSGTVNYAKGGIKQCVRAISKLPAVSREELENAICDSLNEYFKKLVYTHPHYQQAGGPDFFLVIGLWSPKDGLGLYETLDATVTEITERDKFAITGIGGTLGRYLAGPMMGHSGYSMPDISTISTHVLSEVMANVESCGKGAEFVVLTKEGVFSSIVSYGTSHVEDVFAAFHQSINMAFLELCDLSSPGDERIIERLDALRTLVISCRQQMLRDKEKHRGRDHLIEMLMDWKVRRID
jgi:20S proteasome alpha/beta subunit